MHTTRSTQETKVSALRRRNDEGNDLEVQLRWVFKSPLKLYTASELEKQARWVSASRPLPRVYGRYLKTTCVFLGQRSDPRPTYNCNAKSRMANAPRTSFVRPAGYWRDVSVEQTRPIENKGRYVLIRRRLGVGGSCRLGCVCNIGLEHATSDRATTKDSATGVTFFFAITAGRKRVITNFDCYQQSDTSS